MYTLTVKLKQHTPLIHFQHDQDGATLRASEVKPKLDKFILSKLTPEERIQGKNDGWIKSKNGKSWLDYKMKIRAEGTLKEYLIASLLSPTKIFDKNNNKIEKENLPFQLLESTPFFAQEKVNASINQNDLPIFLKTRNENDKYNYTYNDDNWELIDKKGLIWNAIEMTIFSLHDTLIQKIDNLIAEFLICTNFGTRSSKGFGSFTRLENKKQKKEQEQKNIALNCLKSNYKFVYSKNCKNKDLNTIFNTVKEDYQKIKSGINHNGYFKSILFCYAVEKMKGIRWEKRFFKKASKDQLCNCNRKLIFKNNPIYDHEGNTAWDDPKKYDYRYLRAVLGLAEQYEFLLKDNNGNRDNKNKLIVKPQMNNKVIERYESPLLIKIINDVIYIVGNEINQEILNKEFNISYMVGDISLSVSDEYNTINTPESFCLSEFMDYAMNQRFKLGYKKEK